MPSTRDTAADTTEHTAAASAQRTDGAASPGRAGTPSPPQCSSSPCPGVHAPIPRVALTHLAASLAASASHGASPCPRAPPSCASVGAACAATALVSLVTWPAPALTRPAEAASAAPHRSAARSSPSAKLPPSVRRAVRSVIAQRGAALAGSGRTQFVLAVLRQAGGAPRLQRAVLAASVSALEAFVRSELALARARALASPAGAAVAESLPRAVSRAAPSAAATQRARVAAERFVSRYDGAAAASPTAGRAYCDAQNDAQFATALFAHPRLLVASFGAACEQLRARRRCSDEADVDAAVAPPALGPPAAAPRMSPPACVRPMALRRASSIVSSSALSCAECPRLAAPDAIARVEHGGAAVATAVALCDPPAPALSDAASAVASAACDAAAAAAPPPPSPCASPVFDCEQKVRELRRNDRIHGYIADLSPDQRRFMQLTGVKWRVITAALNSLVRSLLASGRCDVFEFPSDSKAPAAQRYRRWRGALWTVDGLAAPAWANVPYVDAAAAASR